MSASNSCKIVFLDREEGKYPRRGSRSQPTTHVVRKRLKKCRLREDKKKLDDDGEALSPPSSYFVGREKCSFVRSVCVPQQQQQMGIVIFITCEEASQRALLYHEKVIMHIIPP